MHEPQATVPDNASAAAHTGRWRDALATASSNIAEIDSKRACGRLTRAAGLVLEAVGLRMPVGSDCLIELPGGQHSHGGPRTAEAEVVGFGADRLYLMPQSDVAGLVPGARVYPLEPSPLPKGVSAPREPGSKRLPVGDGLLGRVLDAAGRPLDGLGPITAASEVPLSSAQINPLMRAPIETVLDTGVRAINGMLTVGRGQRMGLFAGSGVGKSVLLGMMARYTNADVIVVGLIGERGREVKEFIENILGEEGRKRSVVVAAPADCSPLLRMQGAAYATRLAEYFRDKGQHVLLIMDSLTRYAMAQREIALAIGEPPATKGYPPSVFAKLPTLVERTGNGPEGGGSITAFYTVLTEGDDQQDPIADSARAILDGHIVLSRSLAEAGHYPAIDVEASISRAMTALIEPPQFASVRRFKQLMSRYQRNRDLISVGAYVPGNDPELDLAIRLHPRMEAFLQQDIHERADYEASIAQLHATIGATHHG
ncbi:MULTISPECIES: flagellar protein export ATPase FliI [unclassified Cupriavidus]|jgi:flagellum-specific ATP synthase|uniref:flagellar protein export ATPase FliI n=1 Tax=unclassified Cupriavidus TaxID=2640874 RepID=UPI001C002815|nr:MULTISPECIES: flagellar protein export ATPase FliI [unclassified Cupriavidus]MCA3192478.1 flagellar protein export ATPase FliI [Cupriavidus sp.]MCA3198910.1 flagellar protein export ATPase FliI [Cupriavidus sp.]MCA3205272.1 flagellar protein export ATPase FliI [Cupriavidus sp.]MCA3207294.1 flagellar protein export ATPase FliI [Cupriavidus sp.]MCA3234720.1 flagellar protein export ATPase FliI [Cupriavidus sp.]